MRSRKSTLPLDFELSNARKVISECGRRLVVGVEEWTAGRTRMSFRIMRLCRARVHGAISPYLLLGSFFQLGGHESRIILYREMP